MKKHLVILAAIVAASGCGVQQQQKADAGDSADQPSSPSEQLVEVAPIKVTPVSFSDAGEPIVDFQTPGMHCEACAATIMTALKEQKSVIDVTADTEAKTVSVTFAKEGFHPEASIAAAQAVAAIAEAGFGEATPVEASSEEAPIPTEEAAG